MLVDIHDSYIASSKQSEHQKSKMLRTNAGTAEEVIEIFVAKYNAWEKSGEGTKTPQGKVIRKNA